MAIEKQNLDWARHPNHHIIDSASDDMPELLLRIPNPPERLFVVGNIDALHMPALAIVGSRNPTRGGRQNAYEFAKHLGRSGFCIVSGLADGIDTAAHEGALDAGAMTVAYLGHGIDQVYPASNVELARRIALQGALCSEFPLGSNPRREHFPQRNRLISGTCLGTLVVEAAKRSGSLISARLASEQGREVFAIPGSIHNPMSRGCHQLIRQGAKLVESAADIIDELGPLAAHLLQATDESSTPGTIATNVDTEYEKLYAALSFDPATTDELARASGLTIEQVSSMLLILELEEKIEAIAGGRYSRLQK
ncbi:MAG: DNA-processing protein DprA [Proteobacteria bacterium]|nr:DNA-processing protein DprA [Pseudomonadota bacterium]